MNVITSTDYISTYHELSSHNFGGLTQEKAWRQKRPESEWREAGVKCTQSSMNIIYQGKSEQIG